MALLWLGRAVGRELDLPWGVTRPVDPLLELGCADGRELGLRWGVTRLAGVGWRLGVTRRSGRA